MIFIQHLPVVSEIPMLLRFQLRHSIWCTVLVVTSLSVNDVRNGGDVTRSRNGSDVRGGGSYHPSGSPVAVHTL